jgi:hypothetical protein
MKEMTELRFVDLIRTDEDTLTGLEDRLRAILRGATDSR